MLKKDNKGQFVITSAVLIIGIIIAFFLVSGSLIAIFRNLPLLIGGALMVISIVAIAKSYMKRGKIDRGAMIFFGILMAIGLILIFSGGLLKQTVFSVDEIKTSVEGGKVVWTVYASASDINEQYDFVRKFSKYEFSDGTTVTPQKSMAVLITEKSSTCQYSLIDLGNNIKGLSVPSKNIDLLVLDGNSGKSQILEGEKRDSVTIEDTDGKGQLIVTSEGLLGGQNECPDYENVAIVERDGKLVAVYKDVLLSQRNACLTKLFSIACIQGLFQDVPINTQFTSAFDSYEITSSKFTGSGLDLGTATFTIRADQDYFDSVVYTPAKDVKPEIVQIDVASEIRESSSSSIMVTVKNKEDTEGKITITPSSADDVSFSPNSRDLTLSDTVSTTFTIANGDDLGDKEIKVEACFIGYSGKICDSKTKTFTSTEQKEDVKEECGDGICQSFESYTTCPADCKEGDKPLICDKWYQEKGTTSTYKYSLLGFKFGEQTEEVCRTASWIYLVSILSIILILGFAVILTSPARRMRK